MSTANIIGNAIFGLRNKSGGNYINPAVKESLVGLWKFDQNTNESPTRNIIKNTIKDKGGDLELLNFGYKLNSGYGKYIEDFSLFTLSNRFEYSEISNTKVTITAVLDNSTGIYHSVTEEDSALYWNTFKIKVSGSTDDVYIRYTTAKKSIRLYNGINTVVVPNDLSWHSFTASATNVSCNITLEFVPEYEGALVTDGKDDMIVSQKTVQEMLGGSNVCTVVSMIHQINLSADVNTSINNIRSESVAHVCARHLNTAYGKTGIFGYSKQLNTTSNPTLINNILGDKKDYIADGNSVIDTTDKYFVQGYKYNDSLYELSEVAIYWTFIANKVLTTDEINQIIAYFKLDKYVTPQVIYDVKRQGLTNDTPAADWYLKDFSGNGHDMQLYNYAKSKNSGIGKYAEDFTTWTPQSYVADSTYTSNKLHITNIKGGNAILYTKKGANAMKVKITRIQSFNLVYRYIAENDVWEALEVDRDGIYELPASTTTTKTYYTGFTVPYYTGDCDITIEQIPDYEGALVSDGNDDYGKVENLPIYKDYTVAIDRAWTNDLVKAQCLTSKLNGNNFGSFSFELIENGFSSYSFGISNKGVITIDSNKKISYQSKYVYNGSPIISGNNVDGKDLFLFRSRDSYPYYAEAAIWSYILFPYSLSEFLLERQLKRYKLGTLYPDMVEFRPVVSGNIPYDKIEISQGSTTLYNKSINKTGIYLQEGSTVRVYIQPSGIDEVSKITINGVEYTDLPINRNGYYYADFPITKSPQKISYAIDEYIRYEDIVQPYPAIVNIPKVDGGYYTYGDKIPVGYKFIRSSVNQLLPELYQILRIYLNGEPCDIGSEAIVSKNMVFTSDKRWLGTTDEPLCILSPQKLNIPNSSLKILGYVPDLTGKGNHGKLNNFAYAGMSGANGYLIDFNTWSKINAKLVTDNKIVGSLVGWICYLNVGKLLPTFKVFISGIPNGGRLRFTGSGLDQILQNGENTIQGVELTTTATGFLSSDNSLDWSNLVIQQIGEHEGSICFDGTDDHITIPTLAHGGKCVMMKVNWSNYGMLYDQRPSGGHKTFGIYTGENHPAYSARNNGSTYIDGILNTNIIPSNLAGITHNITAVNDTATDNSTTYPILGTSFTNATFSDMSLYEFMLFPEIPSEDEIKKLNDVMGIEGGYVESPNYYWDAYGKKNTDTDRNLIADQVSKDVANALEVKNVGYNSESGYTDDNGLLLDGVEDHAVNTAIPAFTDFTVIAKRTILDTPVNSAFCCKGEDYYTRAAFILEFRGGSNEQVASFGTLASGVNLPDLITFMTATSYNGRVIGKGTIEDTVGLWVGRYNAATFWKGVFYKAMVYSKTIDMLSINMLKNLFAKDELIDVNNPIFKKEELTKIGF